MKKNLFKYGKKSLSLFLTVMMLLSCWVWVAPTQAEAVLTAPGVSDVVGVPAMNGTHYRTADKYGTPVFNGNLDRSFKWLSGNDYTTVNYPSNIYLDISETLQSAGYYWNIDWHFGDSSKYRILLGSNVWGDHNQSGDGFSKTWPDRYYAMTNAFNNYSIDSSVPQNAPSGAYPNNGSDYDLRIVGYGYSTQGDDGFSDNGVRHNKYLLYRSNGSTDPHHATLYLKGTPKETGTYDYNTSGDSFASYGVAQKYGSSWSNHDSTEQFRAKGSDSSYYEGSWIEMQWNITIYDKSSLNSAITTAKTYANNSGRYTYRSRMALWSVINAATTVLQTRAVTQSELDAQVTALNNAISALEERKFEFTYENMFSLSDWWASKSSTNASSVDLAAGKVTVVNTGTAEKVTHHSGSAATAGTRDTDDYSMPVEGGKQYTVKYTTDGADTQMFAFFYNSDGGCTHSGSYGGYNFTVKNGTGQKTFTAPAGSTRMEIRFDCNGVLNDAGTAYNGYTANYWDVQVYETDRATEVDYENWLAYPTRYLFSYNETVTSSSISSAQRKGYDFSGWVHSDMSTSVSNNYNVAVNTLSSDDRIVYSTWESQTLDVNYDNLFSLSGFVSSGNSAWNPDNGGTGTYSYDAEKGSITINNIDAVSGTTPWAATKIVWRLDQGAYYIPVTPGETYCITYNTDAGAMTVRLMFWSATDVVDRLSGTDQYKVSGESFTVPDGANYLAFSFINNNKEYGVATISNIGVFKKDVYDAYAKDYTKIREPFKYGDTHNLTIPTRDGYDFDGWYTAATGGSKIESVAGLYESTTVYAQWTKVHTVTFLNGDGSVIETVKVRNGGSATAPTATPTKAADATNSYTFAGWKEAFTSVTSDLTINPTFTAKAHTNFDYYLITSASCEKNAWVRKTCKDCSYNFGEMYYDGTEITEYIKLGHNFDGQSPEQGTATTVDGVDGHLIYCSRYFSASCGGTKFEAHVWPDEPYQSVGGSCIKQATDYFRCTCGATKTEPGDYVDKHNNTELRDYDPGNCTTPGYSGDTWCTDCGKMIKQGSVTDELGHSFTNYKYNNDASCGVDGTETASCERGCGETHTRTATGTALSHSFTTYTYNDDARCDVDGTETASCDHGCGEKDTRTATGTALTHKFDGAFVSNNNGTHVQKCTQPECTVTGNEQNCSTWVASDVAEGAAHKHYCADCNYEVEAAASDWSAWTSTNAGGTVAGEQSRTCNLCGKVETTSCNYESADTNATCTQNAYTTYTCTDCGHGYTVIHEDTATGHDYTSGTYKYNADTDKHQQLCKNGCGTYGVGEAADAWEACAWTYANTASGTHKATCACGNSEEQECSGGNATCTAKAVCQYCNTAYGELADHSFNGAPVQLEGDFHAFLCENCGDKTGIQGIGTTVNGKQACSGGTATCSAKAVCTACGDTYGEINPNNHKWLDAVNVEGTETHTRTCAYDSTHVTEAEACFSTMSAVAAPDCETAGYTVNTCEDCGHVWYTDHVEALDHIWSTWTNNNNGTHTRTCLRAGCVYNETEPGTAKTETASCSKDNADAKVTAPSCTEEGYTTYTCKDCGYVWVADKVEPTGHSFAKQNKNKSDTYKRTDKDCTTDLTYWYKCDNCDVSASAVKDDYEGELTDLYWVSETAKGHQFDKKITTDDTYLKSAATCYDKAVYYYACSVCGASSKDFTGATFEAGSVLAHVWTNTEKYHASEADCVNDETYYKECSLCHSSSKDITGETWAKENTKKGHVFFVEATEDTEEYDGYTAGVAATCTTDGTLEHYTCKTCGKKYADKDATTLLTKVEIAMLGHIWKSVAYKAPTCEEDGHTSHQACTREGCDAKSDAYKVYDKLGHDFSSDEYFFDSVNNYHAQYCKNGCGEYGMNTVDENGKITSWVKYAVSNDELDGITIVGGEKCTFTHTTTTSTDENGVHSHQEHCICGNVQGVVYEDKNPKEVDPTCTTDGYTLHTCPKCGDTWKTDVVPKLGHDMGEAVSNGDGTHSATCKREGCGYKATAEKCSGGTATCKDKAICDVCKAAYGETTDHTLADDKWVSDKNATCTADGTESQLCSVCSTKVTRTEENSKLNHNMTDYVYDISAWDYAPESFDKASVKAPTCEAEGLAITYCTRCDYYKTKVVKADSSAHVWKVDENGELVWSTVGGNCATGVTLSNVCTVCGKTQSKIENVEHTWNTVIDVKASCEEAAYKVNECSVCKIVETVYGDPATGHSWENGEQELVVDKAASCGNEGRGHYVCTVCSKNSASVVIEKQKHAWDLNDDGITDDGFTPTKNPNGSGYYNRAYVYVEPENATCTYNGHFGYYKCSYCSYDQHLDERWIKNSGAFIPQLAHVDHDGNGKCDTCNTKLYSGDVVNPDDSDNDCSCMCHKDGFFMQLIYKIFRFFWKLFKTNKSCSCGTVHY